MSECMTFDVFAAEEKYRNEELTSAADIAHSILNEALLSIFPNSEKVSDSNRIGDCNVVEEFLPTFDFAPANPSESNPGKINDERPEKKSNRRENPKDYGVIEEQASADSELGIQNGKILLQTNDFQVEKESVKEDACIVNKARNCSDRKSKPSADGASTVDSKECSGENEEIKTITDKPFTPLTTEDLRQSMLRGWKDVNSELLNGSLDGGPVDRPEEAVRLMEELSTLKRASPGDPNRPRSCTLVEEDVKKMTREIEEMNFNATIQSFSVLESTPQNEGDRGNTRECTGGDEEEAAPTYALPKEMKWTKSEASNPPSGSESKGQNFEGTFHTQKCSPKNNGKISATCYTESDEAFIEFSEGVLQIIEPREDSNDENEEGGSIKFSLFDDPDTGNYQRDEELAVENYDQLYFDSKESFRQEDLGEPPAIRSGMTTVGPVKNLNYDPKFLAGPEVDYGKMTKITGSTVLRNDSATDSLLSSSPKKICVDERDEDTLIFFENGYVEFDAIVNHDIASLTKVQKVKEVLSDQPKSNEDFKSEEKHAKSLDLKDVDAESSDSYNLIDSGIPFITVDEPDRSINKEFDENFEIRNAYENNVGNFSASSEAEAGSHSDGEEAVPAGSIQENDTGKQSKLDERHQSSFIFNKSVTQLNVSQNQKHNTISRVLQKASNRFIMKDSDSFLRNSKSLPRDTAKMANTESFKSLLDDCQTSAAVVLKKSRSLLRNTQNVLKAVSRTGFGQAVSGDKEVSVTQETNPGQEGGKRSPYLKSNGFLKLKDSIKNKVGKTLKSLESISPGENGREPESPAIGNETENLKKISPKSPLVCTNQLSQNQTAEEKKISTAASKEGETEDFDDPGAKESRSQDKLIEVICGVKFQGNRKGLAPQTISNIISNGIKIPDSEGNDYISAESVPEKIDEASKKFQNDSAISSNLTFRGICREMGKNSVVKDAESRSEDEASEGLTEKEDEDGEKSMSRAKLRKKNKKLSERIRSFWHGAFGKVKASSQRKNLS